MTRSSLRKNALAIALSAGLGVASLTAAVAAEPAAHIRGTVVSATDSTVTVKTADGNVDLKFDASTRIAGVVPSSLSQIKEGTFVGIANVPGGAASNALEVVVFPEAMKGAGLGDYPWDLAPKKRSGGQSSSAMTNGTVKSSAAASATTTTSSAMTNGTVKKTASEHGLVLTVDYGKGEKTIKVPANVPVVGIVPADRSKLLPGAHVFVATKPDAPTNATFISVGIDGTVPPM